MAQRGDEAEHDDSSGAGDDRADSGARADAGERAPTRAQGVDRYASAADTLALGWVRRRPKHGLWLRGALPPPEVGRVAVVGSRRATDPQLAFAAQLGAALARRGVCVFSGGALGVDATAQRGAMAAGGVTVSVLPGGFSPATPRRHATFFAEVAARGGLLACLPDGGRVDRGSFYGRNAVLASAVDALIVVAADQRSGSLHAVGRARAVGVPVAAVPWGPDSPNSAGCLGLIERGEAQLLSGLAGLERWLDGLGIGAAPTAPRQQTLTPLSPAVRARGGVDRGASAGPNIDGLAEGWQRYAPRGGAACIAAPDDERLAAVTDDARVLLETLLGAGAEGCSLESMVTALGLDRDATAATLLDLSLEGLVSTDRWGRYHAAGSTLPAAEADEGSCQARKQAETGPW